MVAGHETTSGATVWCLFALTQAPEIQRKLREELLSVDTDTPTMDELSALPYLDMVTKESLRFHAPVPMTHRSAQKDDIIPLEKPYTDRYGQVQTSIKCACTVPVSLLLADMHTIQNVEEGHHPHSYLHPESGSGDLGRRR